MPRRSKHPPPGRLPNLTLSRWSRRNRSRKRRPIDPAAAESSSPLDLDSAPVHRRFAGGIIALLLMVSGVVLGGGVLWYFVFSKQSEEQRYEQAKKDYEDSHYGTAARAFKELAK